MASTIRKQIYALVSVVADLLMVFWDIGGPRVAINNCYALLQHVICWPVTLMQPRYKVLILLPSRVLGTSSGTDGQALHPYLEHLLIVIHGQCALC
jgi:hypothetical protein